MGELESEWLRWTLSWLTHGWPGGRMRSGRTLSLFWALDAVGDGCHGFGPRVQRATDEVWVHEIMALAHGCSEVWVDVIRS